jgi:hypothetical protein
MGLFHKDVFMPKRVRGSVPNSIIRVKYSRHAENAAKNDRYGVIPLTPTLNIGTMEIVEVEHYDRGGLVKFVAREVGQEKNRVLVVMRAETGWLVKTVWYNLASDNHSTLNRSLYERPVK